MKTSLKHTPYRVFPAFLALILLLSILTVPVFAEPDDTPTESETQTAEAPVQDCNPVRGRDDCGSPAGQQAGPGCRSAEP